MQNPEFENLLLLLENQSTFELGMELTQHYQSEFEAYFDCKIDEYKELVDFLVENEVWNFETPLREIIELNLSEKNISKLPESIEFLENLRDLHLYTNQLTSLPENITKLKNLQHLDLSYNQLITLPESIGKLENLQSLWLNDNQLTTLPESIEKLQKLQKLTLDWNELTSLPENIGEIKKLQYLRLCGNQLTSLPENLKNLEICTIYISEYPTPELHECVKDWKNIIFKSF